MREIRVGARSIGPGRPVFIIAELGYSFKSLEEALAAVDAAAEAGVDAVKLQTFRAQTVVARGYQFPPEAGGVDQFDEFKRYEISEEQHRAIFERARQRGIVPFSSPSHYDDVELLERLDVELYKIGSDDLTNLPFIEHVARIGKPMIVSTGMGTLEEVAAAVEAARRAGNDRIVLLQCVSNYPIQDPSLVNLRVVEDYRKRFGVLVGFSDHTVSFSAPVAATSLGCVVLERHYALSKKNGTPDAFFSADPGELAEIVRLVRETERMLGDGAKRPTATESRMREYTRKSVIARSDLRKGRALRPEDVIIKRPAVGIQPADLAKIIGRPLKKNVAADEPLTWDCL